eukprot:TRINITY_DN6645_c0_g1_i1.p1 TRINITY_DN6645_c0_g1~~TRINITY_DN6645_c0_g1_i1.p1  ORF type:complete len:254 (-),score=24.83 TRINITY_DN6645_c0_g1_i1:538-1299(-)
MRVYSVPDMGTEVEHERAGNAANIDATQLNKHDTGQNGTVALLLPNLATPRVSQDSLVVGQEFIRHSEQPTVWLLKVGFSASTKEEVEFRDSDGNLFFRLQIKARSLHSKRVLLDKDGAPVCCLFWKGLFVPQAYICRGSKHSCRAYLARAVQEGLAATGHFKVFLTGNKTIFPDFEIRGSLYKKNFMIMTSSHETLAEITNVRGPKWSYWLPHEYYQVSVAPRADTAFVAALVCFLDKMLVDMDFALLPVEQ